MFGNDATKEWADGLKVGDEVIVQGSHGMQRVTKVGRVTPAQIIVDREDGTAFWKKNCEEVGGSRWHRANILPATEERKTAIREAARLQRAKNKFSSLTQRVSGYTVEQLEAVVAILEPKEQPNEQVGTNGRAVDSAV